MDRKPIRNDFFRYILANVTSSVGVSIYILIDTFFISKGMGSEGLAALNLALPVFNFLNGFGLMLGVGQDEGEKCWYDDIMVIPERPDGA